MWDLLLYPIAVIIGSSTQQMLVHLRHIMREDYTSVIVEDPGYDGAREAFNFHCSTLAPLPVYETGAAFSQLEKIQSRFINVTPSHHSPYGEQCPYNNGKCLFIGITR